MIAKILSCLGLKVQQWCSFWPCLVDFRSCWSYCGFCGQLWTRLLRHICATIGHFLRPQFSSTVQFSSLRMYPHTFWIFSVVG